VTELVRAFGLTVESSFPIPGLRPGASGEPLPGRRCRVSLEEANVLERDWPFAEAERIDEERFDGHVEPARTIDRHPELGYRLYARHFGLARVSADGTEVRCAPPDAEPWRWQRFLVGRILPIAAVLQGLEGFHASAVACDGRALALLGPSGGGKSSIALRLLLRGATFITDDVLVLEPGADGFSAHAGPGTIGVRAPEELALGPEALERAGRLLGRSDKAYLELERVPGPVALGALYFIRPGPPGAASEVREPRRTDPLAVLASTFVLSMWTPKRQRNHLDLCGRLASSVRSYELIRPPDSDAGELAAAVEEHARAKAPA
jgi:HPr kinase/phosphorylase